VELNLHSLVRLSIIHKTLHVSTPVLNSDERYIIQVCNNILKITTLEIVHCLLIALNYGFT